MADNDREGYASVEPPMKLSGAIQQLERNQSRQIYIQIYNLQG